MELDELNFDIKHQLNIAANAFSHVYCVSVISQGSTLVDLHDKLYHPGVSRFPHFVRSRNLPFQLKMFRKYMHLVVFVLN